MPLSINAVLFEKNAFNFPTISPSKTHTRNSAVIPNEIKGFDKESPIAMADKQKRNHPLELENMVLILVIKGTFLVTFWLEVMGFY